MQVEIYVVQEKKIHPHLGIKVKPLTEVIRGQSRAQHVSITTFAHLLWPGAAGASPCPEPHVV